MLLYELLRLQEPLLEPTKCKAHLAGWNGFENPLQVYSAGEFDKWQAGQTKRNFERRYVMSLIRLPERHRLLYVGAYESIGSVLNPKEGVTYDLRPFPHSMEPAGRVVCNFERAGRQPYLNGESVASTCSVHEVRPEKLHLAEFPGFKKVNVSFRQLHLIFFQSVPS